LTDKIVVLSNCASSEEAAKIARALVEARLAACVNIIPGVRSIYRWQGAVEDEQEWTLLIKTRRGLFDAVKVEIAKAHSYQLPEILAVPLVDGVQSYLDWIDHETAEPPA
jgi:periplasmic divalent cation tolerance protein